MLVWQLGRLIHVFRATVYGLIYAPLISSQGLASASSSTISEIDLRTQPDSPSDRHTRLLDSYSDWLTRIVWRLQVWRIFVVEQLMRVVPLLNLINYCVKWNSHIDWLTSEVPAKWIDKRMIATLSRKDYPAECNGYKNWFRHYVQQTQRLTWREVRQTQRFTNVKYNRHRGSLTWSSTAAVASFLNNPKQWRVEISLFWMGARSNFLICTITTTSSFIFLYILYFLDTHLQWRCQVMPLLQFTIGKSWWLCWSC